MKAGFLLVAVAVIAVAVWMSGALTPPARHMLITNATAMPMMNGTTGTVLTIENEGQPDILRSVRSSVVKARLVNAGNGLPIQTGKSSLDFEASHILIDAPESPFEEGQLIPVTLTFDEAGDVSVKLRFATPDPQSMQAHMAMGHGTMVQNVSPDEGPTLMLSAMQNDSGWVAQIKATNFTFSEELQDSEHVPGTGHGHIYLGGMKLGRVFGDTFALGQLPPGKHVLRVTLNTNDHRAYVVDGQPVAAESIIEVD